MRVESRVEPESAHAATGPNSGGDARHLALYPQSTRTVCCDVTAVCDTGRVEQLSLNTIANIVTAVCAILITFKIY